MTKPNTRNIRGAEWDIIIRPPPVTHYTLTPWLFLAVCVRVWSLLELLTNPPYAFSASDNTSKHSKLLFSLMVHISPLISFLSRVNVLWGAPCCSPLGAAGRKHPQCCELKKMHSWIIRQGNNRWMVIEGGYRSCSLMQTWNAFIPGCWINKKLHITVFMRPTWTSFPELVVAAGRWPGLVQRK